MNESILNLKININQKDFNLLTLYVLLIIFNLRNMARGLIISLLVLGIVCLSTVSCSLSWVNWQFNIINEPKDLLITNLYMQDSTMPKNSTFILYFNMLVVGDTYYWSGPKSMVLDTGRVLSGSWDSSPKGQYEKNQTIRVQWSVHTGQKAESFKVIFTDMSSQIKFSFILPNYRVSNLRQNLYDFLLGFAKKEQINQ